MPTIQKVVKKNFASSQDKINKILPGMRWVVNVELCDGFYELHQIHRQFLRCPTI